MDQSNHTAVELRQIRDAVARQSRPLDDPAANHELANLAHKARGEGVQRRDQR